MAQSFNTNLLNVAFNYLHLLKVPVTKTALKKQLEQNPYFPSLYSISNSFSKFNIANQAFTISADELEQFEPPFIAYYANAANGKDFILVTKNAKDEVCFISEGNKEKIISKADFISNWQKIVLVAEANEQSGEKNYALSLQKEKQQQAKQYWLYAGLAAILLLLTGSFIYSAGNSFFLPAVCMAVLKIVGLTVAVLLLIYEVDKSNAFVKNICTAGGHTNCDAVLNSKAAKVLGISWSEAGFFYFASTTFFLFTDSETQTVYFFIAAVSTLAAAYIPFSIYYQWKVVKQWCPLCLTVQAVLLLELMWAILTVWMPFTALPASLPFSSMAQMALCVLLPVVSWYLIKPLLQKAKNETLYQNAYKRLLYNPEVFNGLLQQQETAPDGWQHLGITIGNPEAENTIIKVCSPYCGPCAKTHPILEEIITHNENVNLKIIFTVTNNENDKATKPVQHLLAIDSRKDRLLMQKALDDWYLTDKKDYEIFACKYPMNSELQEQKEKIDNMKNWCDDAGIIYTPTLFVNGKRVPETYSTEGLKNVF